MLLCVSATSADAEPVEYMELLCLGSVLRVGPLRQRRGDLEEVHDSLALRSQVIQKA